MEGSIMKVLGIVGSPRKGGNTEILVKEHSLQRKKQGRKSKLFWQPTRILLVVMVAQVVGRPAFAG
jgi:hypothetical protein